MAIQNITYDNKEFLNQNVDVPLINKVTDDDLNEIKSVVNNNATELQDYETSQENEDITSSITFNEVVTDNTRFIKKGNMVYVEFQGSSITRSQDQLIATIPEQYRPIKQFFAPAVINASTYACVVVNPTGLMRVNFINDNSVNGRLYANFWYSLD